MKDRVIGALMRLTLAATLLVVAITASEAVRAETEVTTGFTFTGTEYTGGEHYEFTWYTDDRDWRFGLAYTSAQTIEDGWIVCGSLGSEGDICYRRDRELKAYPSAYIQRVWRSGRWYAALGVTMHEAREPLTSTTATFRPTFGYRIDRWSIEWTHLSNGSLRQPNRGQDLILIRYRW